MLFSVCIHGIHWAWYAGKQFMYIWNQINGKKCTDADASIMLKRRLSGMFSGSWKSFTLPSAWVFENAYFRRFKHILWTLSLLLFAHPSNSWITIYNNNNNAGRMALEWKPQNNIVPEALLFWYIIRIYENYVHICVVYVHVV